MKVCGRCGVKKDFEHFSRRRGNQYQSWCKPCFKSHQTALYQTPKERLRLLTSNKKIRMSRRAFVKQMKDVPCTDCGHRYPADVMEFDHREPHLKSFGISGGIKHFNTDILAEEMAKCDVVCANCHRIRTKRRREEARESAKLSHPTHLSQLSSDPLQEQ